ncbi:MAG: outer membrane lipoprotein-sorting protein [Burkholderiales bacterium PBB1]|nr:MAG: outer membrane lipoprotein-sorting protein [Burkholderiales bacterium PBB1]
MKTSFTAVAMACGLLCSATFAATEADVDASFRPYKSGVPSFPGLTPGTVVSKANVEQFKEVLDEGLYTMVKNGWTELKVGATTSFEMEPNYVEATRKNINKAKLGAKTGEITGFVAGRPFPEEPSLSDPQAGDKIAWNYKYGINWGDNAAIYPFYWKYRNLTTGQVERQIKFNFHFLNFQHRVRHEPIPEVVPNPANLFRGIYVNVLEPQDLKFTQLLIQINGDDTKLSDAYLYLGFQRRVRRLATAQTTDAFLGSDLMIEDFEGYNGRISDMKWTYKGTKNILMPYYNHNDQKLATDMPPEADGYKFINFGGLGGCFPDITWQLRKVYVVEAAPVNPSHPVSKRVLHIDAQVYNINRTLIYDRKGELWKSWTIGKSHPDHHLPINKGSGIAIDDSFSMVDVQSKHCTTGQFKGQIDSKMNPPSLFQVQNLRGGD